MEEYMTRTREGYGSGIARPKIEEKDPFELKGQFLKELRDNTFSGSDNEDVNEHIEKVIEIVDLFHIPSITQDQVMLRVFPMSLAGVASCAIPSMKAADAKKAIQDIVDPSQKLHNGTSTREIKKVNEKVYVAQVRCELCKGPHYTKDCPPKEEGKTLEEAYYTQLERRQSMEESLSKFMAESAKRHKENSNLIKDIRASIDTSIRNQGASIKSLEIQIEQMSKVLQERGYGNLPSLTETNLRDHVKSISTTVDAATIPFPSRLYADCCDEEEGSYGLKDLDSNSIGTTLLDDVLPPKEKDRGSFTLPCYINNSYFNKALATLGASVSVMPFSTYTNLGLGELAPTKLIVELADRTMKRPKDFAVVENMDSYRDERMVDIIVGISFCRDAYIKARRFDGMITIYKGKDSAKLPYRGVFVHDLCDPWSANRIEGLCHVGLGHRVTWGVGERGWYCSGEVGYTVDSCGGEGHFGGNFGYGVVRLVRAECRFRVLAKVALMVY
uniref:Eukaryotic translation initiation factor 3 subunit G N-terminal domain-containing protein n=1 Tax=Tanacetum cinerariifolium TaxID=118510 RepID=A0A6L2N772_TANCI|nr:hypothetical protein [Tanacetum cinerariifolium]